MDIEHKISLLIPDGESHLLVYVINCLSNVSIDIYVLSSIKRNSMRFSKHIKEYNYLPETENDAKWIEQINKAVEKWNIDVVMPIFENGIYRVIKNKDLFVDQVRLVSLPDLESFSTAINKWKLAQHCELHQINIPKGLFYQPNDPIAQLDFTGVKFPVIIKPLEGFGGGMGIEVFSTEQELSGFLQNRCTYPVIIQNYIKGYDIDCSILAKEGKITSYTIQQGTLAGSGKFMPSVGVRFTDSPELLKLVEKLIKSLSWDGVAHIDCRYDEEENAYKIIEVNPRIWVTVDGSYLAGVNFPYLWILQSTGKVFDIPVFSKENYLNLKGVVKSVRKNILFLANMKFLMTRSQFRFVIYDPVPTLYKFYDRTRNIWMRKWRSWIVSQF